MRDLRADALLLALSRLSKQKIISNALPVGDVALPEDALRHMRIVRNARVLLKPRVDPLRSQPDCAASTDTRVPRSTPAEAIRHTSRRSCSNGSHCQLAIYPGNVMTLSG
jgi:hypothetical protein